MLNEAAIGYMMMAATNEGLEPEVIQALTAGMQLAMDIHTESEAVDFYENTAQ